MNGTSTQRTILISMPSQYNISNTRLITQAVQDYMSDISMLPRIDILVVRSTQPVDRFFFKVTKVPSPLRQSPGRWHGHWRDEGHFLATIPLLPLLAM